MRNQKRILTGIVIVAMCGLFSGCNNGADDPFDFEAQLEKEIKQIDDYLAANSIAAVEDPSGIRMVITKLGTGLPALAITTVDVDYKGTLLSDGSTFQEATARATLNTYIPGWQIAFSKLPEGSEAKLYIPSYYAYANNAREGIPANSTLVFDVKFKEVVYPSSYLQKLAADTVAIDTYLESKGILDDVVKNSQIRYVITTQGSGAMPALYDKLKISYTITLLTKDTESVISLDREPGEFFYSRSVDYVQGLLIGLSKMQEGSKATLYIPSGLGFGVDGGYANGVMVVPPNANLIIEIELKEIL